MKPEQILLDVHTHTIASGHAFSSLQEMVHTAADKGLKILGITEHAPGIPGTCAPIYFRNLHVVPRHMYGVESLLGAELNILTTKAISIWKSFIGRCSTSVLPESIPYVTRTEQ